MSAAVGRYEVRASVDDQLERLGTLSIMVHSAVEAAEGVHIRRWWLRRWLWTLRDAALDADEVLRIFRRRRAAEEAAAVAGSQAGGTRSRNTLWSAAWSAVRSAKRLLFGGKDDGAVEMLGHMVARLEREAMGLGDFLKVLDLEIRRSQMLPVESEPEPPVMSAAQLHVFQDLIDQHHRHSARDEHHEHGLLSYMISHEQYVAGVTKMGLLLLRQRIRRALDKLITWRPPPVEPPAASRVPDPDRLRDTVARIRRAVELGSAGAEFHGGERCWLALWRGELQAVSDRAERVLMLAVVPVDDAGGDDVADMAGDGGGSLRRTARSVEMAAAQLEAFVELAGLARRQMQTPWRQCGSRDIKGTFLATHVGLAVSFAPCRPEFEPPRNGFVGRT